MRVHLLLLFLALSVPPGLAQIFTAAPSELYSGGATTIWDESHNAFGRALKNMESKHWTPFRMGKNLFIAHWKPRDQPGLNGLGPLYNAPSCDSCHFKDGRGRLPGDLSENLVVSLSVPGSQGPQPHPRYGGQLQDHAVPGATAEGVLEVSWSEQSGVFADGQPYHLRKPQYKLSALSAEPLSADTMISVRMPPQIYGLGLLEAIPQSDLVQNADPEDLNRDGISGRVHWVKHPERGDQTVGRFGWKASKTSVSHQINAALSQDMGVTSTLIPIEPSAAGDLEGAVEIEDYRLERLLHYVRALAVPGRRFWDKPDVAAGASLFRSTGCAACHQPKQRTGSVASLPELANQTIFPFTDLLLHDMGEPLADNRPDGQACGREWRTPPLWGLGYLQQVSGETRLLHDGRARSFAEAILWHDGEANAARARFVQLPQQQRDQLCAFLGSL